jgi:hypothetical protein
VYTINRLDVNAKRMKTIVHSATTVELPASHSLLRSATMDMMARRTNLYVENPNVVHEKD